MNYKQQFEEEIKKLEKLYRRNELFRLAIEYSEHFGIAPYDIHDMVTYAEDNEVALEQVIADYLVRRWTNG